MNSIINKLIEGKEEELRKAEAEEELRRKTLVESYIVEIREELGEFFSLLEEIHKKTGESVVSVSIVWSHDYKTVTVKYLIRAIPEEELSPILVVWTRYSKSRGYNDYDSRFRVGIGVYSDLGDALRAARKYYPTYIEKIKEEKVEEFEKALSYASARTDSGLTEEEAVAVYDRHVEELPERKAEAWERLVHWIEKRKTFIKEKEEEKLEKERKAAEARKREDLERAYIFSLAEWKRAYAFTLEKNTLSASAIQMVSDSRKYRVYKLTYALVARYTEDGEAYRDLETRSVWTFQEAEDDSGYFIVDGRPIHFYNVVSIEPRDVKPSEGILAKTISRGGVDLYFAPDVLDEKISEILETIEELPEEPDRPREIDRRPPGDWHRAADVFNLEGDIDKAYESMSGSWF